MTRFVPDGIGADADVLSDLGVGIVVFALDGRVLEANDRARELIAFRTGMLSEMSLAASGYDVVDEQERPMSYEGLAMVRAMRTGRSVSGVTIGIHPVDGSRTQWLLCSAHLTGDGVSDTQVVCSFVDVTEQRVALDAVQERDRRFRQLAENAVDMIFRARVVPDLAFEYVNPAVENVLGYARQEFYDDFDLALRLLHPDDRAEVLALFSTAVRDGTAEIDPITVRLARRDGGMVWLQLRVVSIHQAGEVAAFEGIVRDVTALKTKEADLTHLALHDALTGIPNRTSLLDALDRALERSRAGDDGVAVLYLDLDRFKTVNDGLGHDAGDRVLVALAARLADAVRPSDKVGRIGGDEFAAVLPRLRDVHEAVQVATRLLGALGAPLTLDEGELVTTASIGVAFTRDGQETSAELLRRADVAMYEAKDRGRARIECYTARRAGRGPSVVPG
ncbi:MAG: diguanylate cyclase domain-containing protein [Acidimicrobiia bacterium]